jgi:hypothetical protein
MKVYEIDVIRKPRMWFQGKVLPKGVVYGQDVHGYFYCADFKIRWLNPSTGMPVLEVWRFNSAGKPYPKVEANSTTNEIVDFYFAHEKECVLDEVGQYLIHGWNPQGHGIRLPKINVNRRHGFRFYEQPVPVGAIYGEDINGKYFICTIEEDRYAMRFRDGMPVLYLQRPQKNGRNFTRWTAKPEHDGVTDAIFRFYLAHKEQCKIDKNQYVHDIAKAQEMRLGWETPMQQGIVFKNRINPKKKTTVVIIKDRDRTLDDMADKQRGKYIKGLVER